MTPHIPIETSVPLTLIALAVGLWLLAPRRSRGRAAHELIPELLPDVGEWVSLPVDRAEARAVLERLDALLMDEDLTDEKLREASEGLLPDAADALRTLLGDPLPWGPAEGEGA